MKAFYKGRWTTLPESADIVYFGPGEWELGEKKLRSKVNVTLNLCHRANT